MRAFWRVFFGDLLAGLMNYSYLCTVNEKRRNLRPNWATKITKRAGKCFLVKSQNRVQSATNKIIVQSIKV